MTNMVCGDCDDDCPWFVMTNPKPLLILTASLTERLTVESKTEKCVAPGGLVTPADLEISSWLFSPPQPPRPLRPLRPPAWRPPSRSWCLATCWPDCWRTAGRWVRGDLTRTRILPPALSTPSYHHHWGNCWRELSRASTWSTSGAGRLRWGSCCLMTRRGDIQLSVIAGPGTREEGEITGGSVRDDHNLPPTSGRYSATLPAIRSVRPTGLGNKITSNRF